MFKNFNENDKRKWCLLINPGTESIFCTCYINYDNDFDVVYEFNDGGRKIAKNYLMTTPSMESIIEQLIVNVGRKIIIIRNLFIIKKMKNEK